MLAAIVTNQSNQQFKLNGQQNASLQCRHHHQLYIYYCDVTSYKNGNENEKRIGLNMATEWTYYLCIRKTICDWMNVKCADKNVMCGYGKQQQPQIKKNKKLKEETKRKKSSNKKPQWVGIQLL